MDRVNITRTARKNKYTIGKLYINGKYICNTLEPRDKTFYGENFVLGESAIPVGIYELATEVYSPKFGTSRPRIRGFKFSENILIHEGNSVKDTEGCILVGNNLVVGKVLNSKKTLADLQQRLSEKDSWTLIID